MKYYKTIYDEMDDLEELDQNAIEDLYFEEKVIDDIEKKSRLEHSEELTSKIVEGNLHLCKKYAKIYEKVFDGKVSYDDLFQTASIGLIEAAKRYNSNNEKTFEEYASNWILKAIKKDFQHVKEKKNTYKNSLETLGKIVDRLDSYKNQEDIAWIEFTDLFEALVGNNELAAIITNKELYYISKEIDKAKESDNTNRYEAILKYMVMRIRELSNALLYYESCNRLIKDNHKISNKNIISEANKLINETNTTVPAFTDKGIKKAVVLPGLYYRIGIKKWNSNTLKNVRETWNTELLMDKNYMEQDLSGKSYNDNFTLEDKVFYSAFLKDYVSSLEILDEKEKELITSWFDENGNRKETVREIGEKMNLSPGSVITYKNKILRRLRKHPSMQKYNENKKDLG